jgi:hypothetical protein
MRLSLLGIATVGLILSGCRSKQDVPYVGRWDGQFMVSRLLGKTQVMSAKRNNWRGFVLLYRTRDDGGTRCQMHLENEQETVEVKGHWELVKRQVEITFNDIKIDDAGGLDMRDPNKSYLDSGEIRKALSVPLILNSTGPTSLSSPLVVFGPLEGAYSFKKATLGH